MDADHLDFFKDIDDIRHSFRKFAELLPEDGTLIINADTPKYEDIIRDLPCKVITYGLEHDADYQAADITYDKYGHASFSVLRNGVKVGSYYLKVPGIHNVSNALAAIALGHLLELPEEVIIKGLGSFTGTDRRFQYKGEVAGVTIIDDYAHHPTEIEATLHAAHNYPHQKLWCVFQPHTYTRTKAFFRSLPKHSAWQTMWYWQIFMLQGKQILWEFPLRICRNGFRRLALHVNTSLHLTRSRIIFFPIVKKGIF